LLKALNKTVIETALEEEMAEHLGYDKHDPVGRNGGNSRNGKRPKTVLTDSGEVAIDVPRDRDGSFEPVIVATTYSAAPFKRCRAAGRARNR
jgi:transposase-like protein